MKRIIIPSTRIHYMKPSTPYYTRHGKPKRDQPKQSSQPSVHNDFVITNFHLAVNEAEHISTREDASNE